MKQWCLLAFMSSSSSSFSLSHISHCSCCSRSSCDSPLPPSPLTHLSLARREVHTLAGTGKPGFQDGASSTAKFSFPTGLLWNQRKKTLLLTDSDNHSVREIRICSFLRNSSSLSARSAGVLLPFSISPPPPPPEKRYFLCALFSSGTEDAQSTSSVLSTDSPHHPHLRACRFSSLPSSPHVSC